jgi:hypothetical protein
MQPALDAGFATGFVIGAVRSGLGAGPCHEWRACPPGGGRFLICHWLARGAVSCEGTGLGRYRWACRRSCGHVCILCRIMRSSRDSNLVLSLKRHGFCPGYPYKVSIWSALNGLHVRCTGWTPARDVTLTNLVLVLGTYAGMHVAAAQSSA